MTPDDIVCSGGGGVLRHHPAPLLHTPLHLGTKVVTVGRRRRRRLVEAGGFYTDKVNP